MKAILYIIALLAIAAGGWFSYSTMSTFEKLQSERKSLDEENENRKASIKKTSGEADAMEKERKAANQALISLESERDNTRNNLQLAKKEAASWDSKIASQKEKLDGIQNLITSIVTEFKGQLGDNVRLDQIPGLVQQLEDDLKAENKKYEELETNVATATKNVSAGEAQIADLNQRIVKRAKRIKANALHGRITAVNHDWGFVTVRIPADMPVNTASKLLVKRGNRLVGSLKINAIEGSRIVADVDYKSLTRGMIVQAGDSVILKKAVNN